MAGVTAPRGMHQQVEIMDHQATQNSAAGLGFDAGGTRTRWALADRSGAILAEGEVAGFSAAQMDDDAGYRAARAALADLQQQLQPYRSRGQALRVHAGLTGFGGDGMALRALIVDLLGIDDADLVLGNDIEIAYHDAFAPGEGYLVYAGTGSIAAYYDAEGSFHRAGGRGYFLDDGGGGVWIAREALRQVWRAEDEQPGSWQASPLAQALFAQIGGSDWSVTRKLVNTADRGELGKLAMAVAQAARSDPQAQQILRAAGAELARLGVALANRFGARPFVLGGRVAQLHPLIEASFRSGLPAGADVRVHVSSAHCAAARIAVGMRRT